MFFWRIGSSVHSEKSKLYFFESLLLIFFCVIGLVETEKLVEGVSEGVVKGSFIPKTA